MLEMLILTITTFSCDSDGRCPQWSRWFRFWL